MSVEGASPGVGVSAEETPLRVEINAGETTRLGIAVVTYRRREPLRRLLDAIARLTRAPYHVVVAEDGGDDGGAEWCRVHGHTVVSGSNRGVAWNKNRGLFALAALGCDPLMVIEDDVYPTVPAWEREWIEGTRAWHHLAYLHPKVAKHTVSGAGTAADPWVNPAATAQCLSVSAEVLERVGFLDPRFQGWGHEHAEWTTRIKRAGYGFEAIVLPDGRRAKAQLYLAGGLLNDDGVSFREPEQTQRNRELSIRLQGEPVFRRPWRDVEERRAFLAEQSAAGIDGSELARRLEERRE